MPRIPYAEDGQQAEAAKPVYEQLEKSMGLVPNVVKIIGHSGAATQAMGAVLDNYFNHLKIDTRTREIAYVTVARFNGCEYCQGHHVPLLKQEGLSESQIEQLGEKGFSSNDFSKAEQAIIRFAYETSRDVKASDEAMEALKSHFDNETLSEIAYVVAAANFIQRIGKNFGVELEM